MVQNVVSDQVIKTFALPVTSVLTRNAFRVKYIFEFMRLHLVISKVPDLAGKKIVIICVNSNGHSRFYQCPWYFSVPTTMGKESTILL